MKKQILPLLFLLLSINLFAQSATNDIQEITEMILEQQNQTNTTQIDVRNFSEQGNYSFNSTGGLLNYNPNPAGNLFDGINLQAKHIRVVSLVPGEAAVAMYYNEGSIQPKGYGAVAHYLTRVSETFVKENGKWVMVTGHYSPITGGQGTSQVGKGFSKDE
ncbi:MAG: hypothetical protein HN507_07320 [Flavobacteriaceae bacterium]|jgi:hypothetical protein|nr:hypothetical protein [Flavobacteriaceae bacterium]